MPVLREDPARQPHMTSRRRRVVVMPARNVEKTLADVIARIPRAEVDRIILVDNGSRDRTPQLAESLGVEVIRHPTDRGYGGSQKTGYSNALRDGADVVIMLHADGQYDAALIPALCQRIEGGTADMVIGSRWLGLDPAAAGMPWWKRAGNRFLTFVEDQILRLGLSEYHTGYRAYSRQFLETIPFQQNSDDYVFDTQVLIQAAAYGFTVAEVPAIGRYFSEASSPDLRISVIYGLKTLGALAAFVAASMGLRSAWLPPKRSRRTTASARS
jgi:glycosyltransferase involved in cell wall biosynthesis